MLQFQVKANTQLEAFEPKSANYLVLTEPKSDLKCHTKGTTIFPHVDNPAALKKPLSLKCAKPQTLNPGVEDAPDHLFTLPLWNEPAPQVQLDHSRSYLRLVLVDQWKAYVEIRLFIKIGNPKQTSIMFGHDP